MLITIESHATSALHPQDRGIPEYMHTASVPFLCLDEALVALGQIEKSCTVHYVEHESDGQVTVVFSASIPVQSVTLNTVTHGG